MGPGGGGGAWSRLTVGARLRVDVAADTVALGDAVAWRVWDAACVGVAGLVGVTPRERDGEREGVGPVCVRLDVGAVPLVVGVFVGGGTKSGVDVGVLVGGGTTVGVAVRVTVGGSELVRVAVCDAVADAVRGAQSMYTRVDPWHAAVG